MEGKQPLNCRFSVTTIGNTPTISGNFSKITRNAAVLTASAEITTLADFNQSLIEASIALEEEPELE